MSAVTDPESISGYLNNADFGYFPQIKRWILDELRKTVEDVTSLELSTDMINLPPDGEWKRCKPGDFIHFTLTFSDGQHAYKTFRKGSDQHGLSK